MNEPEDNTPNDTPPEKSPSEIERERFKYYDDDATGYEVYGSISEDGDDEDSGAGNASSQE